MDIFGIIDWIHAGDILAVGEYSVAVFVVKALIFVFVVSGVSKEADSDCERTSAKKVRSVFCN